jgi:hypothetical protein
MGDGTDGLFSRCPIAAAPVRMPRSDPTLYPCGLRPAAATTETRGRGSEFGTGSCLWDRWWCSRRRSATRLS